jgi:hypothetical protein
MIAVLLFVACGGAEKTLEPGERDATQHCIETSPPGDPFDVGDVEIAAPPPGSTAPSQNPPTAESIAAVCQAEGGSGCNPERFISKEAASCVALSNDFELGLEPWKVALVYHHGYEQVVWNVMSKLQDRGSEGYSGGILTLGATDGVVLNRGGYEATP